MKKTETIIPTYLGDGVYAQIERGMIKYLVNVGWLSFPQKENISAQ